MARSNSPGSAAQQEPWCCSTPAWLSRLNQRARLVRRTLYRRLTGRGAWTGGAYAAETQVQVQRLCPVASVSAGRTGRACMLASSTCLRMSKLHVLLPLLHSMT